MDERTHNPPIVRENQVPEQRFCALRLANSYQIDRHSYSAICTIWLAADHSAHHCA